jgi:hypothetical protein
MKTILPPLVVPSGEEPIAAGGWHALQWKCKRADERVKILPPPVTPSGEEPIAAGGW